MNKIKKIIQNTFKTVFFITLFFLISLFIYSAFFYKKPEETNKVTQQLDKEETPKEEIPKEEIPKKEEKKKEKANKKIKTSLKDGLFATVGNKAITRSDIVNEIKSILILNKISYSEEKKSELQQMAVKAVIKRNVKEIEIAKYDFLEFNTADLNGQLIAMANNIQMDIPTLKKTCEFIRKSQ